MDEKYIKENSLVERYLQDKLSTEEREAFEEQFLSSDGLLDELEAAERLQQGLQDLAALEKAHAPAKQGSRVMSMFQSPRYAMAASFLLLISLGVSSVLLRQNTRLAEFDSARALATEIIPLLSVRGATGSGTLNTVQLGGSAQQFVMMLDPGFETYSHYRATVFLLDPPQEPAMLWQVDEMRPGYEEMLALSLPGPVLKPGDFEIQLEGWRDEWPADHAFDPVDTLTFRVQASR
jgi:hypothetical protein